MSERGLQSLVALPLLLAVACCSQQAATGYGPWAPDQKFSEELQRQEGGTNGIEVGDPKIYDDTSLRLLLDQAMNHLAAINSFNEASLTSRLGVLNGSRIDQSQLGFQATGASLPGISSVANGATSQTTTNTNPPSTLPTQSVVTTLPSQNVTTTTAPTAPPAPPTVPAGLAFTPPSGMSGSALDVLNEETQLNAQITGLQLLLEGALSDRFMSNQRIVKPRATIGFPISLTPRQGYRNAVAVVEVEVTRSSAHLSDEPPAVTVILPQEKTYNVAAITDRTTSIGAGVVVGAVGLSGSFMTGHKTYYVVQDQDTVAIQRPVAQPVQPPDKATKEDRNRASFAWEFRPVLGREFVQGGMKQTFVQLAFPKLASARPDCFGTITVRTYWRHFDQSTGLSGKIIEGSVLAKKPLSIPQYDLTPFVDDVTYQDLGDGTIRVKVKSRNSFLGGTFVQVGPTRYDASTGLQADDTGLTFVAPAAALARWTGQVVSRDGKTSGILRVGARRPLAKLDQLSCSEAQPDQVTTDADTDAEHEVINAPIDQSPKCPFGAIKISKVTVTPHDAGTSQVKVEFERDAANFENVLLDIGHQVFGLADTAALVRRVPADATSGAEATRPRITAIVPNTLLAASHGVRAFELFMTDPGGQYADPRRSACFSSEWPLEHLGLDRTIDSVVPLSVDAKGNPTYLLAGRGLANAVVLSPENLELKPLRAVPRDLMATLKVPKAVQARNQKLLVQMRSGEPPLLLDLPSPSPAAKPAPPKVSLDSPVILNTDQMEAAVEQAGNLRTVTMDGKPLSFDAIPGRAAISLKNLRAAGVTAEQKTRVLTFTFKDGTKVPVKLEVVAARVGVESQP